LPDWFTTLHAKYRTPVNSILFVGAVTLMMGIVGLIGVGKQEAFQLLWNASGVFYAFTYLVMFAIPILGLRAMETQPPMWLRIAAFSGFVMTLLNVVVSVVPIVRVESRLSFAAKICGLILITNLFGLAIYMLSRRNSRPDLD
jgi:amino acid transporter